MKDEVLCVIPARGGSKGIPSKNIQKICGKPLIQYTIETAKNSKLISRIIISTDSEKIAKIARKLGVEVPFMRPKKISNDYYHIWDEYQKKSSNESILLHEIDKLEMALQAKFYQDQGISEKDLRSFFATADSQITNKHLRQLLRSFLE